MRGLDVVLEKPQLRTAAVLDPYIEPAVVIPIYGRRGAGVVDEVEPTDPRDVDEARVTEVEECAVPL